MLDYTRIKTVMVNEVVRDLPGLYKALKAAFFNVINVAADKHGTYLYFDLTERKDPRPIVQQWIGKKPSVPQPTTSFWGRMLRKIW